MIKRVLLALCLLLILSGHDMYLKLDTYFFEANVDAKIQLLNGTFEKSDNVITRDRMLDVSLVGNGQRIAVDTTQWTDIGETTILNFKTGEAGTWVAGVSTAARNIEMKAEDFNDYLQHDGVLDMLEWRKENNALDEDAVEKYSKHVKTIFQVGDKLTDDWKTKLDYPIEFIPLTNPYDLHPGHEMQVQLLWKGRPLANQLVYVGSEKKETESHTHADGTTHTHEQEAHTHADGATHTHEQEAHTHADGTTHTHEQEAHTHADGTTHTHEQESTNEDHTDHHHGLDQYRTDAEGNISFNITHEGIWYLRTIYLTTSKEEGLTHESNWATLTFEVGEGHAHTHADDHSHSEEGIGIPSYAYWLGSLGLILVLFLVFNRKKG